jgi:hypothetical protein
MPTFARTPDFNRDFRPLSSRDQALYLAAARRFVHDLRGRRFRKGLRVKALQGHDGIFEMTWAPDGRATFEYGAEVRPGEPYVIWRRVGGHDIFTNP